MAASIVDCRAELLHLGLQTRDVAHGAFQRIAVPLRVVLARCCPPLCRPRIPVAFLGNTYSVSTARLLLVQVRLEVPNTHAKVRSATLVLDHLPDGLVVVRLRHELLRRVDSICSVRFCNELLDGHPQDRRKESYRLRCGVAFAPHDSGDR